jgi:pyruvate kinase
MTKNLISQLTSIRDEMLDLERRHIATLGSSHSKYAESQRNLLHYIALRSHDLRPLQHELAVLGLSSLGRVESHVLASIDAVLAALHSLDGAPLDAAQLGSEPCDFERGARLLELHSCDLIGANPSARTVRIMVTLPSEAESDYTLIHALLRHGMNVARINCAHDGPAVWERMIQHIRRAERAQGRACRILMDLGGPKLRTGPVKDGPAVIKLRPQRDALGAVLHPARVWLTRAERPAVPPTEADASVPVAAEWMARLHIGDQIQFKDARGAQRQMIVVDVTNEGCWAEADKAAYIIPGLSLRRCAIKPGEKDVTSIGDFPPPPSFIDLAGTDLLILTRQLEPGRQATRDASGRVLSPARIGCTLPEIFNDVRAGERVWLDDGRIGGFIEKVEPERIFVRITHARPSGEKLRTDKGINLPDSALKLPALTKKDLTDLKFVAEHADIVGLSFAQSSTDVEMLLEKLKQLGRKDMGIVLKVETRRGFEQLPSMLLAGMKSASLGVMIARGDLAVECGFERMAEVQEEILWICEAAHCPVIWATQVLENLAKQGIPSRAEITDAAMGNRAEAVMLNKGPHILRAVQTLDDILQRMEAHQIKKQSMMRQLSLARTFISKRNTTLSLWERARSASPTGRSLKVG